MHRYSLNLAIRSILKRKFLSIVFVISLILGLVCSFYITGFSYHELNIDGFNANKDQIFRLLSNDPWQPDIKIASIIQGVPEHITETLPEVIDYCQIGNFNVDKISTEQNNFFSEFIVLEASPSFFQFFSFPLISGDENLLSTNNQVVLSEDLAIKLFGDTDVKGKKIKMKLHEAYGLMDYFVSGVVDTKSIKSHLSFDMIVSNADRDVMMSLAYLKLAKTANPVLVEEKINVIKADMPALFDDIPTNYFLQELKDIYYEQHWESKILKTRSRQYIHYAIILGLIIYLVAGFNCINLMYFQLKIREKEMLIKRINGGWFRNLEFQFFSEFAILILFSSLLSIVILDPAMSFFNQLTESDYLFSDFIKPPIVLIALSLVLMISFLSWLLIRWFIRKRHFNLLKNNFLPSEINRKHLPVLILFQFVASIVLIISTITVLKQVYFIHNKDIGMDKDVVVVSLGIENGGKSLAMKNQLLTYPSIKSVAVCESSPMHIGAMALIDYVENGKKKVYTPFILAGDEEMMNITGLQLIEGRDFDKNSDNKNQCIVNKALVDFFGMDNPVGSYMPGTGKLIIGVCKDFLWQSLEKSSSPAYISYSEEGANLLVKLNPELQQEGIAAIEKIWNDLIPDYLVEWSTIGDQFEVKHKKQEHFVNFITSFSVLSIFISVIGLFSLSLFSIRQRIKEIGIRKVNGAKIVEVMTFLNTHFLQLIFVAFIISMPLAWMTMNKWLENFAFRTELNWWIFVLGGIVTLFIALITVSWQSWRAASRNPVEALRYE